MSSEKSHVMIYDESTYSLHPLEWLEEAHNVAHSKMMSDPDQVRRVMRGAQLQLVEHEVEVCCGTARVLKWELRD